MTHFMNTATMPAPGHYSIRRVSREEWAGLAKEAFNSGRWQNNTGPHDADIIREITGYHVPIDFSAAAINPGDTLLVYRAGEYEKGKEVMVGDVEFYFEFYVATYQAPGTQASGETFGEALQAYLALTGTTQAELGRRINAAQGHISKYVSGASSPGAGRIEEIASALGCEIARAGGEWRFRGG